MCTLQLGDLFDYLGWDYGGSVFGMPKWQVRQCYRVERVCELCAGKVFYWNWVNREYMQQLRTGWIWVGHRADGLQCLWHWHVWHRLGDDLNWRVWSM